MSRREFLRRTGRLAVNAGTVVVAAKMGLGISDMLKEKTPPTTLEQRKAEFEKMSDAELAQWILDSTGDEATAAQPIRTPAETPAYKDLKNMAEGKPAYTQTLMTLHGEKVRMEVEVSRDILLFRALLTEALRDPANYFEGKPILIQSGQLTNRSGSHKGKQDKSHRYGNSIDFGSAMIDGAKSDDDPANLYPYDSPINRQLGTVADMVGAMIGVETSRSAESLERVDSLHGEPGLSKDHYHYNVSSASAKAHAVAVRDSIKEQPEMYFEPSGQALDLAFAGISDKGREFIHTYETFSDTTYGDAGGKRGTLTIGYGATYYLKGTVITRGGKEVMITRDGKRPRRGDTITRDMADWLSKQMIAQQYTKPVVAALKDAGMIVTQSQLDALVSYAFHRGGGNARKLITRLSALADSELSNDALAIDAAFMYDINTQVAAVYRNGVTNRYLDTADMFTRGNYRRESHSFDPEVWNTVIAAYFGQGY